MVVKISAKSDLLVFKTEWYRVFLKIVDKLWHIKYSDRIFYAKVSNTIYQDFFHLFWEAPDLLAILKFCTLYAFNNIFNFCIKDTLKADTNNIISNHFDAY